MRSFPSTQIDVSDSVKKARLNELLTEGIITDDVHREVSGLIDQELAAVASELSERDQPSSGKPDDST